MATKIFTTDKLGYCLVGDERDIMVSRSYYSDVINWCKENGISVTNHSSINAAAFGVTLWRVEDERHRMIFMLRWM